MSAVATAEAPADLAERLRQAIAADPGGVLEEIGRREGASYRDVLDALPDGQAVAAPGSSFEALWGDLAAWPGEITFIVHTRDGVFETRGTIPPGTVGRGYFNIHGDSPIGGHIRFERCAAIFFVDRPFFGRRSCSVQFVNGDGEAMFKIFVGRGPDRELDAAQVALFEAMKAKAAA